MGSSFEFRAPAHVTLGSVGPPGQRVFYLQARQGDHLVSLKLEKQQVAFLAGGLREVLADLATPTGPGPGGEAALEEPVDEAWVVRALELAYDPGTDRIVLVASEVAADDQEGEDEEEGDEARTEEGEGEEAEGEEAEGTSEPEAGTGPPTEGGVAKFEITREQAHAMVESGRRLLRSGRPPCPLCGFPLSEDHSCPKTNGHRAPSL